MRPLCRPATWGWYIAVWRRISMPNRRSWLSDWSWSAGRRIRRWSSRRRQSAEERRSPWSAWREARKYLDNTPARPPAGSRWVLVRRRGLPGYRGAGRASTPPPRSPRFLGRILPQVRWRRRCSTCGKWKRTPRLISTILFRPLITVVYFGKNK